MSRASNVRWSVLGVLFSTLVVSGCGAPPKVVRTYPGAERPTGEIATVRSKRNGVFVGGALAGYALNVAATEVDGNAVPIGDWIWQAPPDLELEPGSHTLTLVVDEGGSTSTIEPPRPMFAAEAGHLYELRGRRAPSPTEFGLTEARFAWDWWIVDVTTGTTIASNVSGSPP